MSLKELERAAFNCKLARGNYYLALMKVMTVVSKMIVKRMGKNV